MGFFSWNCSGCGESIKSPYDIPEAIEWHNDIVVLLAGTKPIQGKYDGYGRVLADGHDEWQPITDITDMPGYDEAECWHHKCWEKAGSPENHTAASSHAEDQGFFYKRKHLLLFSGRGLIADRVLMASDRQAKEDATVDAMVDEVDAAVGRLLNRSEKPGEDESDSDPLTGTTYGDLS